MYELLIISDIKQFPGKSMTAECSLVVSVRAAKHFLDYKGLIKFKLS